MNGQKSGEGEFYYPDGSRYVGAWLENRKHGEGVYYYVNDDKYEGEWIRNMKHGQGKYTYKEVVIPNPTM